jgi:hypothetical protein
MQWYLLLAARLSGVLQLAIVATWLLIAIPVFIRYTIKRRLFSLTRLNEFKCDACTLFVGLTPKSC